MQEEYMSITSSQNPAKNTNQTFKGKVQKKSGKRIGFNYIIYKSLKKSPKNDVMKCIYIKGLLNFGTCVIKEGTLGDSLDKQGRDIKDRLMWQKQLHEKLQSKVRVPRYFDCFEENGNYYLVIEHIRGESLIQLLKKNSKVLRESLMVRNKNGLKFLKILIDIVALLEKLHKEKIVHRDASSNNFMIMRNGKIAIIDLELSYSLEQEYPSPPFQLGTHGFMSPQQLATQSPTLEEDIFALGAVIFQMWTYISPSKIIDISHDMVVKKVHFFIPDLEIANIVCKCLAPEIDKRPSLSEIKSTIINYRNSPSNSARPIIKPHIFSRQEISDTIQNTITAYSSTLFADPEKGWFSDTGKENLRGKDKMEKAWYASFSEGAAGIIYMLSIAKQAGFNVDNTYPFIQKGLDLIEKKYITEKTSSSPSLHFGTAGIAVSLFAAQQSGLINFDTNYTAWIINLLDRENENFDITQGISGQGLALLKCLPAIQHTILPNRIHTYAQLLLSMQEKNGTWRTGVNDKASKISKGLFSGISGYAHFLLEYSKCFNNTDALKGAEIALNWIIKHLNVSKDTYFWTPVKDINPWLAAGATGIALPFINAYEVTSNIKYKKFATELLNKYKENAINNSLSQQNGICGLGEMYLEASKVFNDSNWLKKADWLVQNVLYLTKSNSKQGSYWLVEHEKFPTACFMSGNSGVLHFLMRYCYSDNNKFGPPLLSGYKSSDSIQKSFIQNTLLI